MDEERRLFYVAVTRAKDRLFLFAPQMRKMADGGIYPVNPSMFVKEIPTELLVVTRTSVFRPPAYASTYRTGGRQGGGWRRW